jgi:hypothetical protein
LCFIKHYSNKDVWWSGDSTPTILLLAHRRNLVISFTLRPITFASVGYLSLGASLGQSWLAGEERHLFPLPGKPTFWGRPPKNLLVIVSFLNYLKKTYNELHVLIFNS